jgi:hypothetical protein
MATATASRKPKATKTRKYTAKTPEQRAAEIADLNAQLQDKIAAIIDEGAWVKMLRAARNTYRYSFGNQLLIWAQLDARGIVPTQVFGYKTWKDKGRNPQAGQGVKILAPRPWAQKDADGNIAHDDQGREIKGIAFRVITVWDITGTTDSDGNPYVAPSAPLIDMVTGTGDVDTAWNHLAILVERKGFTLQVGTIASGADGETDFTNREVVIASRLTPAQRVKTLAHELGHIEAEHGTRVFQDRTASRAQAEAEAESIAYVVSAALGLDSVEYSALYVTGWAGGDIKLVQAAAGRVLATSSAILKGLDELAGAPAEAEMEDAVTA